MQMSRSFLLLIYCATEMTADITLDYIASFTLISFVPDEDTSPTHSQFSQGRIGWP